MLLNGSSLNATAVNNTAGSGMINGEGSSFAAMIASAAASVIQPAFAAALIALTNTAVAERVVLPTAQAASTSIMVGAGVRHAFGEIAADIASSAEGSASLERFLRGESSLSLETLAAPYVQRRCSGQSDLSLTYFADPARLVYAEGLAAVEGIVASNGMRTALGIGRADLSLQTNEPNGITTAYASAQSNIGFSSNGGLTVTYYGDGSAELSYDVVNTAVTGTFKASGYATASLRPSASAHVFRKVNNVSSAILQTQHSARASHTFFMTASAFANHTAVASATIPSYVRFSYVSDVEAVRTRLVSGVASVLATPVAAEGLVIRNVAANALVATSQRAEAAIGKVYGAFKHDAFGSTSLVTTVDIDESLVLRYSGFFALTSFTHNAYASQKVAAKALAVIHTFTSSASTLVYRSVLLEPTTFGLTAQATAIRVAILHGDAETFALVNSYATRRIGGSGQATLSTTTAGELKFALKASGASSAALTAANNGYRYLRSVKLGTALASASFTASANATGVHAAKGVSYAESTYVAAAATRATGLAGGATLLFVRKDATALSNLTMPAPDDRSLTVEAETRSFTIQE